VASPNLRLALGVPGPAELLWGIAPVSAGVFGVPAGFLATVLVSWLTPPPSTAQLQLVDRLRSPPQRSA